MAGKNALIEGLQHMILFKSKRPPAALKLKCFSNK